MEHYVSLFTERQLERNEIVSWLNVCKRTIPDIITTVVAPNGKNTSVSCNKFKSGKFSYSVPLLRHLDALEVAKLDNCVFSTDENVWIEASKMERKKFVLEDELSPEEINEINTHISKVQHENWVSKKIKSGWTKGAFDPHFKKSPLLTGWDHIPEESRFVDETLLYEFIEQLKHRGIVLVKK